MIPCGGGGGGGGGSNKHCLLSLFSFNLLKIRMREDIFGTEKCKVTFGLKYMSSLTLMAFVSRINV